MSARRQIVAALSEDSMGGIAALHDVNHAEQLVDAHRAEVLNEAAELADQHNDFFMAAEIRSHATVPNWPRPRAVTQEKSSRIAADATPGEDYPGETEMLRGLVATLSAVAEHGDLADVQKLLAEHASDDEAARQAVSS
jgi:hypothetical protein